MPEVLSPSQWALLHALELIGFDLAEVPNDLAALEAKDLVGQRNGKWHLTDHGKLLVALRRQI